MSDDNVIQLNTKQRGVSRTPAANGAPAVHHFPTHYVLTAAAWYARGGKDDLMMTLVTAVASSHDDENGLTQLTTPQLKLIQNAP